MTRRGYRADIAFDGERAIPAGALVLVEDGVILGVEPGCAPAPGGCEVTYLPGTALLPGLIDTHSHLCGNNEPDALDRLPGGDPACDFVIAWTMFSGDSRETFRSAVGQDPAMWARARGWALWKALISLAENIDKDETQAAGNRRVIDEVLADHNHAN
jgi:hypothetical protein